MSTLGSRSLVAAGGGASIRNSLVRSCVTAHRLGTAGGHNGGTNASFR